MHTEKTMKLIYTFCLLILITHGELYAIDNGNFFSSELRNKSTLVVLNDTNQVDVILNMYIKVSPALENAYNAGVGRIMCNLVLLNLIKLDSVYSNTKLNFHDEYTHFQFVLPNKEIEIERILSNIYRNILIDSSCFKQAKQLAIDSYKTDLNTSKMNLEFDDKVNSAIWGAYSYKKAQDETNTPIDTISYKELKKHYDRYFKSYYTLFVVKGKFNAYEKFLSIDKNTLYDESLNSSYIPISTVNIYNNLITSNQFVYIDSAKKYDESATFHYQIVSNYQDNNGYIKSTIVEEILNYFSHQIFDSIGISNFKAETKLYKNATTFNISYTPNKGDYAEFCLVKNAINNIDFTKLLVKNKLIEILKSELNKYSIENKNTQNIESNLLESWSLNKVDDFFNYDKRVKNINIEDVSSFYNSFIKNKNFVFEMYTQNTNITNPIYDINVSIIKNTVLYFDYNLSDLTKEMYIKQVEAIKQWMLINPDAFLQVNGYADKNEYTKVTSTEVDSFLSKYPKFKLLSSFKYKNTWKRLDLFRALKICKYLIESGVNSERINGSSVLLPSKEREEMQNNQKVTFTLYITR